MSRDCFLACGVFDKGRRNGARQGVPERLPANDAWVFHTESYGRAVSTVRRTAFRDWRRFFSEGFS